MEPDPRQPTGKMQAPLLVIFMVVGAVLLVLGLRQLAAGNTKDAFPLCIGGAMFTGVPILLFFVRQAHEERASPDAFRHQTAPAPWLVRDDWAKGEIVQREKYPPYIITGATTIVLAAIISAVSARRSNANTFLDPIPLVWFGAVGLALLVLGLRALIRRKKFGESVFRMFSVPGLIGGKLEGKIELGARLEPLNGFIVRLRCLHITGSGKSSRTTTLWQDTQQVRASAPVDDPAHSAIPVSFAIPEQCQETHDRPGDRVTWVLEARARVPGTDYLATFEVPVFKPRLGSTSATQTTTQMEP